MRRLLPCLPLLALAVAGCGSSSSGGSAGTTSASASSGTSSPSSTAAAAAAHSGATREVAVGGFPTGIAFDSSTNTIYVANGSSNTLSMIDADTCNATDASGCTSPKTVSTAGQDPIAVAIDARTDTLYVVNGASNDVSVINGAKCNATNTSGCQAASTQVKVGNGPELAAVDQAADTVYVTNTGSNTVSMIDTRHCNAAETSGCASTAPQFPVGVGPILVAVAPAAHTVYVGNTVSLSVIDAAKCNAAHSDSCASASTKVPVGAGPLGFALDSTTNTIYLTSFQAGTTAVLDATKCDAADSSGCAKPKATVGVGRSPRGDALDAASGTVYVANDASNSVSLIDAHKCNAASTTGCADAPAAASVGNSPRRVVVDERVHSAYVTDAMSGAVTVIDTQQCNAAHASGC